MAGDAFSEVSKEMAYAVPGLSVIVSQKPDGAGFLYSVKGQVLGGVRSLNGQNWRIDGDPDGYPFSGEKAATVEMLRRTMQT